MTTEAAAPLEQMEVAVDALKELTGALFASAGLPTAAARRMAEALVEADQQGIVSHGVAMVPVYVDRLAKGLISSSDSASVVQDRDAVAVLDAGHMFGHLAAEQAMTLATTKAAKYGIAAVSVRHGFHFGVAGRYTAQAAEAGCIGIAMSNTRPMMAAPGGLKAIVGNNPIAIAAPSASGVPIMLDMALSEAAFARIRQAARRGEPIPANWAVAPDGSPTTDPGEAIAGTILPVGGAKGFALSLLVDVMCGVLSSGAWGDQVNTLFGDQLNDCSFLFIAIDIGHFRPLAEFNAEADDVRSYVRNAPTRDGKPGLAPGDRRAALAAQQAERVMVDLVVLRQLRQCAERRGVNASALTT